MLCHTEECTRPCHEGKNHAIGDSEHGSLMEESTQGIITRAAQGALSRGKETGPLHCMALSWPWNGRWHKGPCHWTSARVLRMGELRRAVSWGIVYRTLSWETLSWAFSRGSAQGLDVGRVHRAMSLEQDNKVLSWDSAQGYSARRAVHRVLSRGTVYMDLSQGEIVQCLTVGDHAQSLVMRDSAQDLILGTASSGLSCDSAQGPILESARGLVMGTMHKVLIPNTMHSVLTYGAEHMPSSMGTWPCHERECTCR